MGNLGGEAPGRGLGLHGSPCLPSACCAERWRGKGCPPTECSGSTFRYQDGNGKDGLSFLRVTGD